MICYFPEVDIKSSSDSCLKALDISRKKYMGMAVSVSLGFAFFGLFFGFPESMLAFAFAFSFFLVYPKMEIQKRIGEIETTLPFFLRSLGMLMTLGIPFEKALATAARGNERLNEEMKIILKQAKDGITIQRAFLGFAKKYPSLDIKRAVSQVVTIYETGGNGIQIKQIGDELLAIQKHKLREYSSKSAMIGLVLILSTAILPTFFLVYAVAGRFALSAEITDWQISVAMLLLFPAISIGILAVSKSVMPRSAFANKGKFDFAMLGPGAIIILGFLTGLEIPGLIIGAGIGGYFIFRNYGREKRLEEIEARLPDALFSVSGLPKSTNAEKLFRIFEEGEFGELSNEAKKSRRQIKMNVKMDKVLEDFWERNNSSMLKRACIMIEEMIATNSLDRLSMLAEDIISGFQIKREHAQLFSLQKYTLIFGALLVPLILKITLYLLDGISSLMEETAVIGFAAALVPPYLVIYATIASIAIAEGEGKRSSSAIYLLLLSVASLATFHFISL